MALHHSPINECIRIVAERFNIPVDEIMSRDMTEPLCRIRMIAMHVARRVNQDRFTINRIALRFDRDRSSILNASRRISEASTFSPWLSRTVEELVNECRRQLEEQAANYPAALNGHACIEQQMGSKEMGSQGSDTLTAHTSG
jgi:hypothetical protein